MSWTYWVDGDVTANEYGLWAGDSAPALGFHFHDEGQLTLVLSGSRKFEVGSEVILVDAGLCLYIPAGLPHRSLPHSAVGTKCLNIYYSPANAQQLPVLLDIRELAWLQEFRNSLESIGDIATSNGLSREAFSRKFTRDFYMSPHAYRLVGRLNAARKQLRGGAGIADTAADFGFADQSHFGRHFFRVFGVTPSVYRNGMRQSQTF